MRMCLCVKGQRERASGLFSVHSSSWVDLPLLFHYFRDAALFLTMIFSFPGSELEAPWHSVNKSWAVFYPIHLPQEALSHFINKSFRNKKNPPPPPPPPLYLCLCPRVMCRGFGGGWQERSWFRTKAASQGCPRSGTLLVGQAHQQKGVSPAETLKFWQKWDRWKPAREYGNRGSQMETPSSSTCQTLSCHLKPRIRPTRGWKGWATVYKVY